MATVRTTVAQLANWLACSGAEPERDARRRERNFSFAEFGSCLLAVNTDFCLCAAAATQAYRSVATDGRLLDLILPLSLALIAIELSHSTSVQLPTTIINYS